jgi:hypothetical protein
MTMCFIKDRDKLTLPFNNVYNYKYRMYTIFCTIETYSKIVHSAEIRMWHIDYIAVYTLYEEHFDAMI